MKLLEAHGITLLPEDSGGGALESTMVRSGQQLSLTEAGKLALTNLSSSKKGQPTPAKIIRLSSSGTAASGSQIATTTLTSKQPKIIKISPQQFAALKAGAHTKPQIFCEHF